MDRCCFSTDISDRITCDPKGEFDDYGFNKNKCDKYPCDKIKSIREKQNERTSCQN